MENFSMTNYLIYFLPCLISSLSNNKHYLTAMAFLLTFNHKIISIWRLSLTSYPWWYNISGFVGTYTHTHRLIHIQTHLHTCTNSQTTTTHMHFIHIKCSTQMVFNSVENQMKKKREISTKTKRVKENKKKNWTNLYVNIRIKCMRILLQYK